MVKYHGIKFSSFDAAQYEEITGIDIMVGLWHSMIFDLPVKTIY